MLTSKEFIFYFLFIFKCVGNDVHGWGHCQNKGPMMRWYPRWARHFGEQCVSHPRALYPSCKDDEANAILNLKDR
jgi:hypothetical protein